MLSDGFLDERVVLKRWGQDIANELSTNDPQRPSWIRVDGGWQIHDFEKHHPTKAEIAEKRSTVSKARSEAGKRGNEKRWDDKAIANESQTNRTDIANHRSESESESETETKTKELKSVVPRKRGTRIPEPFMMTNEMRIWATTRVPGIDINSSTEKFVNYWRAKTGNATKLDWTATWHNWLISDFERNVQGRKPTPEERAYRTLGLATDIEMGEIGA